MLFTTVWKIKRDFKFAQNAFCNFTLILFPCVYLELNQILRNRKDDYLYHTVDQYLYIFINQIIN